MLQAYVGMGSNKGDGVAYLNAALEEILNIPETGELKCSSFYQTTPVGPPNQQPFMNAVCTVATALSVEAFFHSLCQIELRLGKVPKGKYEPRVIDLDLLFFGTCTSQSRQLQVPHPFWQERLFVLVPLLEVAEEIDVPSKHGVQRVNLRQRLQEFVNKHEEHVIAITKPQNRGIWV